VNGCSPGQLAEPAASAKLYKNGQKLRQGVATLVDNTITYARAITSARRRIAGDEHEIDYRYINLISNYQISQFVSPPCCWRCPLRQQLNTTPDFQQPR